MEDTQPGRAGPSTDPSADPPDAGPPLYKFGSSEERIRSLVHSIGLIVAAFIAGFALAIVGLQALFFAGYVGSVGSIPPAAQALAAALQFVGFLLVGMWYLRWRGRDAGLFRIAVPSLRDAGWAVAGLVGLFVLLNVVSVLIGLLGVESAENAAVVSGRQQPTLFLYLIGVTLLFTAPAEELLFRGLIQGLFRSAYGVLPGILITAVLFGVVHFVALAGGGSPVPYIAVAAALGVVLGAIYERTENLAVPIVVHGLYNAILFYAAYLAATGQIEMPG
jgi:membrane protease YdiL (CAAX protease family)